MICTLAGIRWCTLLEWPCWLLMVATGIEEEDAMLLSGVTAMCAGTLGGTARWPWPTLGAGAMSRLGMGDFMAALMGPSAKAVGWPWGRWTGGPGTETGGLGWIGTCWGSVGG